MKITELKSIVKKIEKQKTLLAARRDALRELVSETEELRDTCETAYDDLQSAIDKLSEFV